MSTASHRRGGVVAIIAVAALLLAGCASGDAVPVPTSTTAAPTIEPSPTPTPDPEFVAGGTAGQNRPYFEFVIAGVLERSARPSSAALINALSSAGFDRATIEITADTTPVGERADSILVGIPIEGQCLLGQVIDGALVTELADLLGTGRCLVGKPASLD